MPHKTTLFFVLFSITVFTQTNGINIVNEVKGKEVFIEESKRIRIKTSDGQKHQGQFYIVDSKHIQIGKETIALNSILLIRKDNAFGNFTSSLLFLYLSAISVVGYSSLVVTASESAFLALIPLPITIFYAFKSPSLNKAYKTKKQWSYSVINHSNLKAGTSFSDAAAIPSLSQAK